MTDHAPAEPTPAAPTPAAPTPRRTHPITPLVSGWKVLAGVLAVVAAQNVARLVEDFTPQRLLIALGVVGGIVVISVAISTVAWRRTTYLVSPEGVTLSSGLLTLTRRTAPRERIESVSIERPALARLLGLAKVRVEIAGGSESHLDIAYVRGAEAEELRGEILRVATPAPVAAPAVPHGPGTIDADGTATSEDGHGDGGVASAHPAGAGSGGADASAAHAHGHLPSASALRTFAVDGVTDGLPIAHIPTARLLRSLVRDLGFMSGLVLGLVWAIGSVILGISEDGIGWSALLVLVPVVLTVPRMLLARIEGGWGFVSRLTDNGLRMRRGLFSTRTDSIGPGRVQKIALRRPFLWRGPGWTGATVTVAGIGEDGSENGANRVLPVGTGEELSRTLGSLLAPLGTDDDDATIEHLLTAPAREIEGIRPTARLFWIARRTVVVAELPDAVVLRTGILARTLQVIPRERIQGVRLSQGPLDRRVGAADLLIAVAGTSETCGSLPLAEARRLFARLATDAAAGRRYAEKDAWPRPVLEAAGQAAA